MSDAWFSGIGFTTQRGGEWVYFWCSEADTSAATTALS